MADVEYEVVTLYEYRGLEGIGPQAREAGHHLDEMGHAAHRSQGALERLNQYALGFVGVAYLTHQLEGLIGKFVELQSEAESLKIELAGMFQAGNVPGLTGPENFTKAMSAADELILKMRQHARSLPGEFQDLMNIFQPMLSTALAAGRSVDDTEKFAARMMATSASMHISSLVAGHELERLLVGSPSAIMPLWRSLKPIINAQADKYDFLSKEQREGLKGQESVRKEWGRLSVDQRIQVLTAATDALQPAIDEVGKSWQTISSTAEDYYKTVTRLAGEAPFKAMKDILGEINTYYEEHKEKIDQIASMLGQNLASGMRTAFEYGKQLVGFLVEHKDTLIGIGKVWLASHAASGLGHMLGGTDGGVAGGGGPATAMAAALYLQGNLRTGIMGAIEGAKATPGNPLNNLSFFLSQRDKFNEDYRGVLQQQHLQTVLMHGGIGNGPGFMPGMLDVALGTDPMRRAAFMQAGKSGLGAMGRQELLAVAETGWSPSAMIGPAILSASLVKLANNEVTWLGEGFAGLLGAVSSLPGPIGTVAKGLDMLYIGLQAFAGWIDKLQKQKISEDATRASIQDVTGDRSYGRFLSEKDLLHRLIIKQQERAKEGGGGSYEKDLALEEAIETQKSKVRALAGPAIQTLHEMGVYDASGNVNRKALETKFHGDPSSFINQMGFGDGLYVPGESSDRTIGRLMVLAGSEIITKGKSALSMASGAGGAGEKKAAVVNVTINQEINEAEDADRVRVDTIRGLAKAFQHPTVSSQNLGIVIHGA